MSERQPPQLRLPTMATGSGERIFGKSPHSRYDAPVGDERAELTRTPINNDLASSSDMGAPSADLPPARFLGLNRMVELSSLGSNHFTAGSEHRRSSMSPDLRNFLLGMLSNTIVGLVFFLLGIVLTHIVR